jgi:hypothetical protein
VPRLPLPPREFEDDSSDRDDEPLMPSLERLDEPLMPSLERLEEPLRPEELWFEPREELDDELEELRPPDEALMPSSLLPDEVELDRSLLELEQLPLD